MPPPLDPDKRAAVLAAVQAAADGTDARSAAVIAREHGVSATSVKRIATAHGLERAWDRTKTEAASRAKAVDNRARRAALSAAMLDDAERLRGRLWVAAVTVTANGSIVTTELPTPADAKHLTGAVVGFVKASLEVDAKDAETEQHAAVDVWLRSVVGEGDG